MAAEPPIPDDRNERSPSPIQPPPTPTAPGPRATALEKLHNDAIAHILKTCSYTNFATCFPTPAQKVPVSLRHLHEQFTQQLGERMRREFEAILRDRKVVPALNELDRLIEDAKRRKAAAADQGEAPVPPHALPAKHLYLSRLAPTLAQYAEQMGARQEVLARENEELIARVVQQRKDIQTLMEGLEGVVADLNGSVEVLGKEDVEGLRQGTREAEEVMRG